MWVRDADDIHEVHLHRGAGELAISVRCGLHRSCTRAGFLDVARRRRRRRLSWRVRTQPTCSRLLDLMPCCTPQTGRGAVAAERRRVERRNKRLAKNSHPTDGAGRSEIDSKLNSGSSIGASGKDVDLEDVDLEVMMVRHCTRGVFLDGAPTYMLLAAVDARRGFLFGLRDWEPHNQADDHRGCCHCP